ncbi:hypothetical protein [Cryptosporangium sp. NPDC051539]|uniref:hypothetical protein n=1 Tax=Cryptosporangium sp. NPDC051539 TaxID=3363962 RepID=UPI0037AD7E1A
MITDEDLSRRLGAAFSDAAADLRYSGPVPTARRTPSAAWLALPVVAAAAGAVAVGAPLLDHSSSTPVPLAVPHTGPAATRSAGVGPEMVTKTIALAGYEFTYTAPAGSPDPLRYSQDPGPVPAGARPIDLPKGAVPGHAWIGKDPATGDAALWVQVPTRNQGQVFAIYSSVWSQDQLIDLLHNGHHS